MKGKKKLLSVVLTAAVLTVTCACKGNNPAFLTTVWNDFTEWAAPTNSYDKAPLDESVGFSDLDSVYEETFGGEVLYLTIPDHDDDEDEKTWEDLNLHDLDWYEEHNETPVECDVIVQFGNEEGPTIEGYGFSDSSANATIKLSGNRASERQQKNYRIKLKQGCGTVSGAKSFVLSKGFSDPYRFSNKLCFDLMSECDDLLSLRTSFVHVYVKDENEGEDSLYVDYGMYTMVEAINKKYLSSRNLDNTGELYKIENFDFKRHEDVIVMPTDSNYDKEEFEKLIEAKGSSDYTTLINLLDDLNDGSSDIEEIVEKYFDEDNLYSWMAFNILMDNKDTDVENFYLYCPKGITKFYIIPWDYDGVLREDYEILKDPTYSAGWEKGIYLYTESELFGRIVRNEHCVNKLSEHVEKLHNTILSSENVSAKIQSYFPTVEQYLYALPDRSYARVSKDNYEKLTAKIPERIDENFYAYYDSIEKPWPFHINEPIAEGDNVVFTWDESYCVNSDFKYSIEVSDSWDFATTIVKEKELTDNEFTALKPAAGEYFVRVTAYSDQDSIQEAYEYYNTEKKTTVHGVLCFYVLKDGTIVKSSYK